MTSPIFGEQIGSGQITSGHLTSGFVAALGSVALTSGQVVSGFIGNSAVLSGSLGSGQIASGHLASGLIAGLLSGGAILASGEVSSGFIGNAAVFSGSIASGQVGWPHLASGAVRSGDIGDGAVVSGSIASGQVSWPDLASGAVRSGTIGDAAVVSGSIASGSVASGHLASGFIAALTTGAALTSGQVTSGFLGDRSVVSGSIASGSIGWPHLNSGLVLNGTAISGIVVDAARGTIFSQYKTVELISGVRCVTVTNSGFIGIARPIQNGSGMPCVGVVYDNVLSGQLANVLIAGVGPDVPAIEGSMSSPGRNQVWVGTSGLLSAQPPLSGGLVVEIGTFTSYSGAAIINVIPAGSGGIGAFRLASDAVQGSRGIAPNVASGTLSHQEIASGAILSGQIGSGAITGQGQSGFVGQARNIASGMIGGFDLGNKAVASGQLEVNQISRLHMASGTNVWGIQYDFECGETISGLKAVAFAMSGASIPPIVVRAERQSGGRLPAIGVTVSGALSGNFATVIVRGFVAAGVSGMIASGMTSLYVGSGGLIVNQSGFMGGASSGSPFLSGSAVQYLGQYVSGNVMYVNPEPYPRSGLISLLGGQVFF